MDEADSPQIPWAATALFVLGAIWTIADTAAGHPGGGGDWLLTVLLCTVSVAAIVAGGALHHRSLRVVAAATALVMCLAGLYRGGLHFLPACVALVVETCLPTAGEPLITDPGVLAQGELAQLAARERAG